MPALSNINPSQNHATVPRLLEGTTYEFRVMAENLQGRSEPLVTSNPVIAKNQFGKKVVVIYFIFFSQDVMAEHIGTKAPECLVLNI